MKKLGALVASAVVICLTVGVNLAQSATIVCDPPPGTCYGTGDGDLILGTGFADKIRGEGGDDLIKAGNGNDRVRGGDGNDVLWGERGGDTLKGEGGFDFLYGGNGDDLLIGDKDGYPHFVDHIQGDNGDDTLVSCVAGTEVGTGDSDNWRDVVYPGNGDDEFFVTFGAGQGDADAAYVSDGTGSKTLHASPSPFCG